MSDTKKSKYKCDVYIYDPIAQELAHLFLPPPGSHVKPEELKQAMQRLNAATLAIKHGIAGKPQ